MKILHYVDENKLAWGETWIQLIKELTAEGLENYVVCKPGGTLEGRLKEEGIAHDTCKPLVAALPITAPKLGEIIDRVKPDIIHTRLSSAARIGGWWGRRKSVPVISTIDKYPKLYYYKNSDYIIPCSTEVASHMKKIGFAEERMQVIHNPVNVKRYSFNKEVRDTKRRELGVENKKVILSAGRFADGKGFEYSIRAYAAAVSAKPYLADTTTLWLVGEGPQKDFYKKTAEECCISDKVSFFPFAQDIRPWLWSADLFVQPSYTPEGFSLMLLESMAAQLPAVATNIGGTLDIIRDNENGWLMPIKDYTELAGTLIKILSDGELLKKVSLQAEKDASWFNTERIAAETTDLYKKVLSLKK